MNTTYRHVELLKTRPGISFIPASSISVLSLLNIFTSKYFKPAGATLAAAPLNPKAKAIGMPNFLRIAPTANQPIPAFALLGISGVFGLSSYSIAHDISNGPSTATAWCVAYLVLFGKSSLQSRQVSSILLTGSVLAAGVVYLREMLDLDVDLEE